MKRFGRNARLYAGLHIALLAALACFPLYRRLADLLPRVWIKCFLHDRLFLYCPFCGGTRAVEALLRFDFATALKANPFALLLLAAALVLDAIALIRLLGKKERLLPLPKWTWIVLLAAALLYAVLRNWLMIAHGIDPIGDLGAFWNR